MKLMHAGGIERAGFRVWHCRWMRELRGVTLVDTAASQWCQAPPDRSYEVRLQAQRIVVLHRSRLVLIDPVGVGAGVAAAVAALGGPVRAPP